MRNKYLLVFLFVVALAKPDSFAQFPVYKSFDIRSENVRPRMLKLLRDHNGSIWAGTDNGLFLFDGINFTKIQNTDTVSSIVSSIYEDKNYNIWAGYENGKFISLADRYEGRRFNSPNDLVLRSNGDVYFTDPSYGLEDINDSPLKELPFNGVFRIAKDGKVTLLTKDLTFPNGIAFSPDERILYVGVSDAQATRLVAYDVAADGTIVNEHTFFNAQPLLNSADKGLVDGLKIDCDGNVWSSGPGGILVISPDGKLLGRINTGVATANCNWGDDGSTLYICADMHICRIKLTTKGAGW